MKLEPNMYVRTEYGEIARIDECKGKDKVYKNMEHYETDRMVTKFNNFILYKEDISKASYNIIDLIEEHDILLLFDKEYGENYKAEVVLDGSNFKVVVNYEQCVLLNLEYELITEEHIKLLSIVTKEQFEQMEYKVGD